MCVYYAIVIEFDVHVLVLELSRSQSIVYAECATRDGISNSIIMLYMLPKIP